MGLQITVFLLLVFAALTASWFLAPLSWATALLFLGRKAAGFTSRSVIVNGIRWHYLEGGKGPALVAIHGFGADADHWLRVGHGLKKRYRVVAPDLVGFGASDPGDALAFDVASQANRLGSFLDKLGIGTCVLVGSSMGGWIATQYAAANPGRVRALWLMAPLGVQDCARSPILKAIDEERDSPVQITSQAEFEQNVLRPMFFRVPWIPYPLRIHYGRRAVRRSAAAERMFHQVRGKSTPLEELAASVRVPVLLQWGEEDRAVDVAGADPLRSSFADIESVTHPRTGHLPMLEIPAESLKLFGEFHHRKILGDAHGGQHNRTGAGL